MQIVTLRFLWNVNDSVVYHGMLVHPFDVLCCACASISLLHECTYSVLDVVIHNISLHLSLINDCLLSVGFTDETSRTELVHSCNKDIDAQAQHKTSNG